MKINWKIRFNKKNKLFIARFFAAVIIPILAYLGIQATDLTSWDSVWLVIMDFITNPYLIILTIVNIANVVPDPTTDSLSDSERALHYEKPAKGAE